MNACFVDPNLDTMTCSVSVDIDGWDNQEQAYDDIEYFAEGSNDPMAQEIEEKLEEAGVCLVYPGIVDDDGERIEFKLEKINS